MTLDNSDGTAAAYMNRPGMQLFMETRHEPSVPFVERYRWLAWITEATDLTQGSLPVNFYDNLLYIQEAETSVGYVQDAHHPHGWTAHEIAADLLKRFHVPVGHLVTTKYRIPVFIESSTTIYEAIAKAYTIDRHMTGNNYYIVTEKGKVAVVRSNGLLGLMGKRLSSRSKFVISDRFNNARNATFTRSLDQYAAGIIPSGGDATLVQGNLKGANKTYAGGSSDKAEAATYAKLNKQEKAIENQTFPPDALTSSSPNVTQPIEQKPGTSRQHHNQLIASALLFGAVKYQVGSSAIPSISDPNYTRQAAQLLADALARTKKTITVTIDGNILLRRGMAVYVELTF